MWLSLWAALFGVADCLAAAGRLTGGSPVSSGVQDVLVVASLLCALEFVRRAFAFFRGSRGHGYWLFALALSVPAGLLLGAGGIQTAARYALGLPAFTGAAWFFLVLRRERPRAQAMWLAALAGALVATAVATVLTQDNLPVSVIHAALALLVAIALVGYAQATAARSMQTLPYVLVAVIVALTLSHGLGYAYMQHALTDARTEARGYGQDRVERLTAPLRQDLSALHSLASWAASENSQGNLDPDIEQYPEGELGVFMKLMRESSSPTLAQISLSPRTGETFIFGPPPNGDAPAVALPAGTPALPDGSSSTVDSGRARVGPITETVDHRLVLWAREAVGGSTPAWGIASMAIDLTAALRAAGIEDTDRLYRQTLRAADGAVLFGSRSLSAESSPIVLPFDVGGMRLALEVGPQNSWGALIADGLALVVLFGFLLVTSAAAVTHLLATRYLQTARESAREGESLRAVLYQAHDGIAMIDEVGAVVFTNPALEEMAGRSAAELGQQGGLDPLLVVDGQGIAEVTTRDGQRRMLSVVTNHVSVDGRPHRLLSARDITDRAQQNLERSAILEAIQDNLFLMDRDHRILWTNATDGPCVGSEGPSGRCFALSAGYAPCPACPVVEAFSSGTPAAGEILVPEKGRSLTWEVSAVPVAAVQGTQTMVVAARDLTPRVELEDHLRQSHKMEAVGQLAGGIAHDFNNILTGILGTAELIVDETDSGGSPHADAQEVKRLALQASSLVDQLLAFSRARPLDMQPVDLSSVVAETRTLLRRVIGEHIEFYIDISAPGIWVTADRGQLQQVLLNLAVNARDAMPDGGRLEIRLAVEQPGPIPGTPAGSEAEIDSRTPGAQATLTVKDTGCGMDTRTLSRAFEPFFTTKPQGKGTGIGLANVYGIVDRLEGRVSASSTVGKGTTFVIRLPLLAQAPATAPKAASSVVRDGGSDRTRDFGQPTQQGREAAAPDATDDARPTGDGGARRILVVEDEAHIRRLVERLLVAAGHEVTLADRPNDALATVRMRREQGAPDFDLLITDIMMPGMRGTELARRMRAEQSDLQVILMSGYSGPSDDAIKEPGINFLPKPFTVEELLRAISPES